MPHSWPRYRYPQLGHQPQETHSSYITSLTTSQWYLLYDKKSHQGGKPSDFTAKANIKESDLDITLIRLIIVQIWDLHTSIQRSKTALNNLRQFRNDLAHIKSTALTDDEFNKKWAEVKKNIEELAEAVSKQYEKETNEQINELRTRSLCSGDCKRLDEEIQKIKEKLEVN